MRAQLLFQVILGLRTMKKSRRQGSKIRRNHSSLDIRHLVIPSSLDIRASSFASCFLRLRGEGRSDGRDQAVPSIGFLAETLAPLRREFVKLGPPIVLRFIPARFQESLSHQTEQRRIKCSLLDEQRASGNLPDAQKHSVAMKRTDGNCFKNEKIEGAGKKFGFVIHVFS